MENAIIENPWKCIGRTLGTCATFETWREVLVTKNVQNLKWVEICENMWNVLVTFEQ